MPVVETTILEGYDAATKARLLKGMMRAVRSVMAAPPDGIVTILREVHPSSYARGGVSRIPGPPLPPAADVAAAFAAALEKGDAEAAGALATPDFFGTDLHGERRDLSGSLAASTKFRKAYQRFEDAMTDEDRIVFAQGTLEGTAPDGTVLSDVRFVDRFRLTGALIAEMETWVSRT
ncbi:nuclear transport factor 2 family protein [Microvirga guangxiensis]|uniref:Phenylpyruvate tautomerase PptA, 4-oxalocrotonate tautomerase family n=1 Tax=Microvirga guangxiensis TaxID=549386 RepID=A0A1G5LAR4_9HYPH|nr:nuclear transport factor 2 family protein [Microvirga guangxiensis]SCZ09962.1 Phenylpyruvate tautomerase PptA, 4-oxalocrotonate tautomerase family [Microvirga guangxiensis]